MTKAEFIEKFNAGFAVFCRNVEERADVMEWLMLEGYKPGDESAKASRLYPGYRTSYKDYMYPKYSPGNGWDFSITGGEGPYISYEEAASAFEDRPILIASDDELAALLGGESA